MLKAQELSDQSFLVLFGPHREQPYVSPVDDQSSLAKALCRLWLWSSGQFRGLPNPASMLFTQLSNSGGGQFSLAITDPHGAGTFMIF